MENPIYLNTLSDNLFRQVIYHRKVEHHFETSHESR